MVIAGILTRRKLMSYNHILVAVDFDTGTLDVVNRAVNLARPLNAKLSLVHVNTQINDIGIFSGLIDTELVGIESNYPFTEELTNKLAELAGKIDYPIANKFVINGDLSYDLQKPVKEAEVDLIVCGHHHNFWSRMKPSAGGLINTSPVDLLIVSLEN
jgi:universal stress protein A